MDGPTVDRFEVGATGIDLDDDGDRDIDYGNIHRLTVDAQGGDDRILGIGFESSPAVSAPLTFRGGPGNDQITGGAGSDDLAGGDGIDGLTDYGADELTLTDATSTGIGTDALSGFEQASLWGTSGADTIDASAFNGTVAMIGQGGSDTLVGGPLDDVFRPGEGDDTVRGGPGSDQVIETVSGAMLSDTKLTGVGTDTLESVERAFLTGTPGSDRIDASSFSGHAQLAGLQGSDVLIAAAGGSSLNGGDDGDELVGGPGGDSFVGGSGDDGISSRDALTEQVNCGNGTDAAVADNLDGLAGCEQIDRGDASAKPGDSATSGADVVAPALSKLTLVRRAARFSLSERAAVTLRLERRVHGRWVRMRGRLTHAGVAGRNRVVLRGRLARRALAEGRYRLVARATDAAGNRSAPRRAGFQIIRR
jgi:Ca2+-binding RTX toxin-like protein